MKTLRYLLLCATVGLPLPGIVAAAPNALPATTTAAATTPPATSTAGSGAPPAAASPTPEELIDAQLRSSPAGSDAIDLNAGGTKVLALYRPQTRGTAAGGVVLLHDVGAHADWPALIGPLRRALPQYGWSTLSVELPAPAVAAQPAAYGALVAPAQARIAAAVAFLKGKGLSHIALVGHGLGGLDALIYAGTNPDPALSALVVIGLGSYGNLQPPQHVLDLLNKVNVPIFDLYGRDDSSDVLRGAAQRLTAARRLNAQHAGGATDTKPEQPFYRQLGLLGAGHAFADQTPMVIQYVYGWLKTHAGNAGKTATP